MVWQILITLLIGIPLFIGGQKFGKILVRQGVTAQDLFRGNLPLTLLFIGLYIGVLIFALNFPQVASFPVEWRFYGMRVTWTILRLILMGVCGIGVTIAWYTARQEAIIVILIGLIGLGGFTQVENYFLSPIHAELFDNLQANGVFRQTSNSSCAPAALATILRLWGLNATESSVAKFAGTSRLGTSMAQLIVAAKNWNMDGIELNPTWEQIQKINRPGILAVWLLDRGRKLPHAVALLKITPEIALIGDPARGRIIEVDRSFFSTIWREEYVPIFTKGDKVLSRQEAIHYLQKLGYLSPGNSLNLQDAIRRFQEDNGVPSTGNLDPQTVLLLSGSFLEGVPNLVLFPTDEQRNS